MTDLEIAKLFFNMLKSKGFGVEYKDFDGNGENDEDFREICVSFGLLDSHEETFMSFDFTGGNFYRISGTDSTGWYGDEVDLRKYD